MTIDTSIVEEGEELASPSQTPTTGVISAAPRRSSRRPAQVPLPAQREGAHRPRHPGVLLPHRDHRAVDRAVRPQRPLRRHPPAAVVGTLVRHHPPRAGRVQPAPRRHPRGDRRRLRRGHPRDGDRRDRRRDRRLHRRPRRRDALGVREHLPRHPAAAAHHHHRRAAADRRRGDGRRGHRDHRLGVGRPRAARADAVVATAGLRRGGAGQRRAHVAHHHRRDPAEPHCDHRLGLHRHGGVRGALAHHPVVHRHRQHGRMELGHGAVPGAVAARPAARGVVVVRAGGPLHRLPRHVAHAHQLRHRRVRQSRACARRA